MTERTTIEEKSLQTARERPTPSLTWTLDPTSGKPVARWTVEQPEMIANFVSRRAA
jgi:hypothetical protein